MLHSATRSAARRVFTLADVRELPRLAVLLSAIRRDPSPYRPVNGSAPWAIAADGSVVAVTVGPRGGITRRTVGRVR